MSSSLALSNAEILRGIALVTGSSRTAGDWDAAFLSDSRDLIRSGLRRFFNPINPQTGRAHQWRFLEREWETHGEASYSTGTVAVSSGTVTLTGGTFPTWAADGILRIDNRSLYVTSRDSGTQLTIDHTGVSHAASTSYTLYQWRFGLPADFAEFLDGVVYEKGSNQGYLLRQRPESDIRRRYAANFKTGDTTLYAVYKGDSAEASDWYLSFWATADENASFVGRYRSAPEDNLDDTDLTAEGTTVQVESVHAETAKAAIMAEAERTFNGGPGPYAQEYDRLLSASIEHDRHTIGRVGFKDKRLTNPRAVALLNHTPTYSDLLP